MLGRAFGYAVYEALLMGVPVVALPIGGQAELISQTPSAQFTAEDTSAKAFIKAVIRISWIHLDKMIKLRKAITEAISRIFAEGPTLYTVLRQTLQ
jgi:glycosyltransferase involved in cell wall biosynthesis